MNWNEVLVLGLTELPNELPDFLLFDFGSKNVNDDGVELNQPFQWNIPLYTDERT